MSDKVRVTDADIAEVLRLDGETRGHGQEAFEARDELRARIELLPRMARELMALREQHRAADEALTRFGFEATSPRDTLADRVARLAKSLKDEDGAP